ncbi:uncharacterized protein LOC134856517, partial [Symsagittifera roscoffensis]|uniref:uncharacterized protein LOC134856517 n=1 Tax=Symsagittifera roscoffensis TaxID=84072 RepID=UPI00307BECDE
MTSETSSLNDVNYELPGCEARSNELIQWSSDNVMCSQRIGLSKTVSGNKDGHDNIYQEPANDGYLSPDNGKKDNSNGAGRCLTITVVLLAVVAILLVVLVVVLLLWTISATNEISRLRSDLDEVKQQSKNEDSNSTTNGSASSEALIEPEYFPNSDAFTESTKVFEISHAAQAQELQDPQVTGQERAERYYQIRTPLNVSCLVMYRFDLEGYSYGVARPLDLVWVGYLYNNQREPKQTSTIDRNSIAGLQMGTKI